MKSNLWSWALNQSEIPFCMFRTINHIRNRTRCPAMQHQVNKHPPSCPFVNEWGSNIERQYWYFYKIPHTGSQQGILLRQLPLTLRTRQNLTKQGAISVTEYSLSSVLGEKNSSFQTMPSSYFTRRGVSCLAKSTFIVLSNSLPHSQSLLTSPFYIYPYPLALFTCPTLTSLALINKYIDSPWKTKSISSCMTLISIKYDKDIAWRFFL